MLHSSLLLRPFFSSLLHRAAEITRLEEEFQAEQSGHVQMHDIDSNDARARLWSVAAFNRMLRL
jgi:chaperone required for assembly of F1-ATPase